VVEFVDEAPTHPNVAMMFNEAALSDLTLASKIGPGVRLLLTPSRLYFASKKNVYLSIIFFILMDVMVSGALCERNRASMAFFVVEVVGRRSVVLSSITSSTSSTLHTH